MQLTIWIVSACKAAYDAIIASLDRVFQPSTDNPSPILDGFAKTGENKGQATIRLAKPLDPTPAEAASLDEAYDRLAESDPAIAEFLDGDRHTSGPARGE